MKVISKRFTLSLFLVLLGVLCRVVPHPWNFAPVGAIALFAGATFQSRRAAFAVPLIAMLLGDVFMELLTGDGLHVLMPVVYGTYALITALGILIRDRRDSIPVIGAGATVGAILFFITTNFAVWATGSTYSETLEGLVACYVAAIPYFGRTLASDLIFSALLFGTFVWIERKVLAPTEPRG